MYFTSSIGDAIRIPLEINDVCLVLLQPWRLTAHQSCSNDRTIHHNRAVPWMLSTDSSDLPPYLRQPPLRSTWLQQRGCTLVASLITIHSRRSIRAILVQRKNIAIGNFPMALYYSIIHAFCWKEWSKTSTWTYFSKSYAWKQDQVH